MFFQVNATTMSGKTCLYTGGLRLEDLRASAWSNPGPHPGGPQGLNPGPSVRGPQGLRLEDVRALD